MKSLISINYKFMDMSPKELIDEILQTKYCKGVEISINIANEKEMNYLESIAYLCKEYNLHFQVHGNIELPIDVQINYMNKLTNISNQLGYPISVVMHTLLDEDPTSSLTRTENYLNELLKHIDDRIMICVENLNDYDGYDRLNKFQIEPIIFNNEKLYMTYDIGHDLADYNNVTDIDYKLIKKIKNIHIHTHNKGIDHLPIYKESFNTVFKGILFLKTINYEGPVVFEYNLFECNGETIKEKVIDYLKSIDYVSERM